jgi:hypothetical protein
VNLAACWLIFWVIFRFACLDIPRKQRGFARFGGRCFSPLAVVLADVPYDEVKSSASLM